MNNIIEKIKAAGTNFACFSSSCPGIDCIQHINKPLHWASHKCEIESMIRIIQPSDPNNSTILVARTNMAGEYKVFIILDCDGQFKVWQFDAYPDSREIALSRCFTFYENRFTPVFMINYANYCLSNKHYCVQRFFDIIKSFGKDFEKDYSKFIIDCNINLFPGLNDFIWALKH